MDRNEEIFTGVLFVTGVAALAYSRTLPLMGPAELSPGLFPTIASVLIIILSGVRLVTLRSEGKKRAESSGSAETVGNVGSDASGEAAVVAEELRPVWIPLALFVLYVAALSYLHFIISSLLFVFFLMWYLYRQMKIRIPVTAVTAVVAIFLLFRYLLGVRLP